MQRQSPPKETRPAPIPWPEDQPLMRLWPDGAEAFGIRSKNRTFELASAGEFPVEVLRLGLGFTVRTADVRKALGLIVNKPLETQVS